MIINESVSENSKLKAYSGYFSEEEKLKASASGGAATAISESFLKRGGIVFGVGYTRDFKGAEYYCAESKDELDRLKGSKYIEADKEIFFDGKYQSIYTVVEQKLKEEKEVLFFGLGCVVTALYSMLSVKNVNLKNLYTVELICHGTTPRKVAEDYIEALEKKYKSKVVDFSVRYKKCGWTPPYVYAKFENSKIYTLPFYDSDYGYAFSVYSRSPCYDCKFKGKNHSADLIIGDYWGVSCDSPEYNPQGVSILVSRTEKGEGLLSMIDKTEFHLQTTDLEFALQNNPRFNSVNVKSDRWEKFGKLLNEKGLHHAVVKTQGRLTYWIKRSRILKIIPKPVKKFLKKFINRKKN